MYQIVVSFALLAAVYSDVVQPDPSKVYCGEMPSAIYSCLPNPTIVNRAHSNKCDKSASKCDKMNCLFRELRWLDGDKIDKQRIRTYFDEFAKMHPEWASAIQLVQTNCVDKDLPAQDVILNCPAVDIVHCSLATFIKSAPASLWLTDEKCAYARAYAAACPVCPSSCFAPQIPIGSCNACYLVPRAPQS